MRNDIKDKAYYLFSEIGNIDERIIAEAESYVVQRSRKRTVVKLVACLAGGCALALILVFTSSLTRTLLQRMRNILHNEERLSQVLMDSRDDNYQTCSEEQLDLFDDKAKLIWRYDDSDTLYVLPLNEGQASTINLHIGYGTNVTAAEPQPVQVWLANGNGTIVTPYIKASNGNIGYGTLFDYASEIEPDEFLVRYIRELMSNENNNL